MTDPTHTEVTFQPSLEQKCKLAAYILGWPIVAMVLIMDWMCQTQDRGSAYTSWVVGLPLLYVMSALLYGWIMLGFHAVVMIAGWML